MEKYFKIILALLLFLCLLDMPFGYYQLVRFLAMIGFIYFGYNEIEKGNNNMGYTYIGLAILFQPIIKIALGRELWNLVDVMVGIGLIVVTFWGNKEDKQAEHKKG